MVNMKHTQINRAISYAINGRVISDYQNIVSKNLSLRERDIGTGTSTFHNGLGDKPDGSNINLSNNDYRYVFDVREGPDLSPYKKVVKLNYSIS